MSKVYVSVFGSLLFSCHCSFSANLMIISARICEMSLSVMLPVSIAIDPEDIHKCEYYL